MEAAQACRRPSWRSSPKQGPVVAGWSMGQGRLCRIMCHAGVQQSSRQPSTVAPAGRSSTKQQDRIFASTRRDCLQTAIGIIMDEAQ